MNFYFIQKTVKFIIIILFFLIIISKNIVYCENITTIYDNDLLLLIIDIKKILKEELILLTKQEDFIIQFRSLFYNEVIMKKDFIEKFVEQLNLEKLLQDNNLNEIKIKILNEFAIFIDKEQKLYENGFLNNIYRYIFLQNIQHIPEFLYFLNYLQYKPNKEDFHDDTKKGFYNFIKDTKNHFKEYPRNKYHVYVFIDSSCYGFNISFFFYNNRFTIYERKFEHGFTWGWDDFFDLLKSFMKLK